MIVKLRLCVALALLFLSANAFAVTGFTNINAAASGASYGYQSGVHGSASSPTLSDGKVTAYVQTGSLLIMRVTGFAANPGKAYFNSAATNCVLPPTVFSSASASSYAYDAGTGTATWIWNRGTAGMQSPTTAYTLSIN